MYCGYSLKPLAEAYTHNVCFERKYLRNQNFLLIFLQFLQLKKNLYIAWACFRNVKIMVVLEIINVFASEIAYSHLSIRISKK